LSSRQTSSVHAGWSRVVILAGIPTLTIWLSPTYASTRTSRHSSARAGVVRCKRVVVHTLMRHAASLVAHPGLQHIMVHKAPALLAVSNRKRFQSIKRHVVIVSQSRPAAAANQGRPRLQHMGAQRLHPADLSSSAGAPLTALLTIGGPAGAGQRWHPTGRLPGAPPIPMLQGLCCTSTSSTCCHGRQLSPGG
jgi:hypothetical protein